MSRKSVVDTVKKLNPKNVSGKIPEALNIMQNLKKVTGNPRMVQAVGAKELMSTLKHIQNLFKKKKKSNNSGGGTQEEQPTPEELAEQARIDNIKAQADSTNE